MTGPGRTCPLHYRYAPRQLCRAPIPWRGTTLYVIGGLYGNPMALEAIERLAREDEVAGPVTLVFNGDFNWFNIDDDAFTAINQRVLAHQAILGNVEYELVHPSPGAGCGCAYPEWVDAATVERSNRIMARLQQTASRQPQLVARLAALPRHMSLRTAETTILILHGDPESLAGWGLARENLSNPAREPALKAWFAATNADIIASSHTCLPAVWRGRGGGGRDKVIVNNGAAGMGNLDQDPRGLITRISQAGDHPDSLFHLQTQGLDISLVPVDFDRAGWRSLFHCWWPEGSAAATSYGHRIDSGTSLILKKKAGHQGLLF